MMMYVPMPPQSRPILRSRRAHRILIRVAAALVVEVFRQVIAR
ncbi:hypothetical protein ACFSR7_23665 [Cohnella sp. GCM10020058]